LGISKWRGKIMTNIDGKEIVMAETDDIEQYEDIAREVMKKIFDINYDECFISDESALSDFAGCCLPDYWEPDYAPDAPRQEKWNAMSSAGRHEAVRAIKAEYGVDVDQWDFLITVFAKIEASRKAKVLQ
jgi:glycogen synthase